MSGDLHDDAALEQSLIRLEALTADLNDIADSKGREAARALLEVVLDVHRLSLERLNAIIAARAEGPTLIEQLAKDPHVRAIWLLHGLHPRSAGERLCEAIARMQPQWSASGLRVDLVSAGPTSAIVQLQRNGRAEPPDQLRLEIENILVDAAPDLDDILIELDMTAIYAEPPPREREQIDGKDAARQLGV
ncbi:nitrogen fixation protein NifU [Methylocystis sp. 9N]|uniref:Nitrogen fixation protein NifU n=1 Tax=Methylocystis borbori TaxID=3118750 RepID=A0ABU7XJC5_9HYPH